MQYVQLLNLYKDGQKTASCQKEHNYFVTGLHMRKEGQDRNRKIWKWIFLAEMEKIQKGEKIELKIDRCWI